MIEVAHLTKTFGDVTAVEDLSFTVEDGELFALLGRNGAGKSTTISCMTTIQGFDAGRITLDGLEVGKDDHAIRGRFGVVFQQSALDPILTVAENLHLRAKFYGTPKTRVDELIEQVEATRIVDRPYGVLSGGERRRVDIARALLHSPSTLFLDEPTTGLDPQSRETVWRVIGDLRREGGLTVVLTTHYMEETEEADRVLIIDRGRAVAEGTPMELRAAHARPQLALEVVSEEEMREVLTRRLMSAGPDFPDEPEWEGGAWRIRVPDSSTALAILEDLRGQVTNFEFHHGSMQDVFLSVTEGEK